MRKATKMNIKPIFKNNSFLVKKQASAGKSWEQCGLKDVRLVTSFSQLQDYIQTIHAKVIRYDKILQACTNWKHIAEFDLSNMFFKMNLRNPLSRT